MSASLRFLLVAAFSCAAASAASLLRDLNAQPVPHAGYVYPWAAALGGGNLFVTDDHVHGAELWISNGTAPGTHLLRDIKVGDASSEINGFTLMNGVAYFYADDGVNGRELWRSDGTYAGTHIVVNIGPGPLDHGGQETVVIPSVGGVMFITADDGVHGQELWRSDGTAAGTWIVADIVPGDGSPDIDRMIQAGNRVFFTATDSAGSEPWVSNGTAAGTHRVGDINPGAADSSIGGAVAVGSTVFFAAFDPIHGRELWRLKAGDELAALVTDLNTDLSPIQPPANQVPIEPAHTKDSDPQSLTASGDSVLFTAVTTSGSLVTNKLYRATADSTTFVPLNDLDAFEVIYQIVPVGARGAVFAVTSVGMTTATKPIFVTDGTTGGSRSLVSPQVWLTGTTLAAERSADGNEVYFFAHAQNSGGDIDLWRSDGTVANTRVFADVDDIVGSWDIRRVGSRLFFGVGYYGDGHGKEMWVSDGTPAGTRMIRDLYPGEASSQPYALQVIGDKVMFAAFTPDDPATFWVTDGTDTGTLPLAKIPVDFETESGGPFSLGASATDVFYLANDGINGAGLWASNGTSTGTRLVKDLSTGDDAVSVLPMMSLGNIQIFNNRGVVWRTDGTTAGTYPLADTAPGESGDVWWPIYQNAPSVVGSTGYFFANDGVHNTFWRTDGSVAGTAMVSDVTAVSPWVLGISGAAGARIFFLGVNGSTSNTLYSTDGTATGTVLVSGTHQLGGTAKVFNGRLCLAGNDGIPHPVPNGSYFVNDIWCSNGSAGDLVRITDGNDHDRSAGEFFVVDNLMFVNSHAQGATNGLWITTGDSATTRQLLTEHASDVVRYGANYLIATYDNPDGPRFLLSDGTVAGTRDLLQGAIVAGTLTGQFELFGNYVMFTVNGPKGVVIWRTDGTPAGTRFVADVNPSTADDQYPLDFRVLGNRLLFTSAHPVFGEELWMLTAIDPNATEDSLQVAYGTATSAGVLANDADIDGTLDVASVQVVDAPASGAISVNAATGAITYTPNAGFAGNDSLTYRVRDNQGNWSNAALLSIVVNQPSGGNPANAPANITPAPMPTPPTANPPPVTPPVIPPASPPPSGGGGGGALGLECLLLGLMLLLRAGWWRPRVSTISALKAPGM